MNGPNDFHIIEDAQVILRSRGVFYVRKVYRRGNRFYANWSSGYIRLGAYDATSSPNVSIEALDLPFEPGRDAANNPVMPAIIGEVGKVVNG